MSDAYTQNQPTIADLKRRFAAYSLAGGALWYQRWLEAELVNHQARLSACEECIADLAGAPMPKGREVW